MATYDLYEELKNRDKAAAEAAAGAAGREEEMKLDDVARVKVLSPGRQVFKRFIRNRLAVFGSLLLITMFVFSFIGPLFYMYGQKQIFYKYTTQNVNYALAKQNTTYNGYVIDDSVEVERTVANAMNSNIKSMLAGGNTKMGVIGKDGGSYVIERLDDETYKLSAAEMEQVCTAGSSRVNVGTYSMLSKSIEWETDEIKGLEAAAKENCKGRSGSFELDGVTYDFESAVAKSFTITAMMDGIVYSGDKMAAGFEDALNEAIETGRTTFEYKDELYTLTKKGQAYTCYRLGNEEPARLYTRYIVNTYKVGEKISDEFRVGALLASAEGGEFTADGKNYTVGSNNDTLIVYNEDGSEYAEFTVFSVKRYSGADTIEYDLKNAIAGAIAQMEADKKSSGTLVESLPMQNENGEYVYDEDGSLMYQEAEMQINRRDTGEYVINADQVNYVIDMFSAPSRKHPLGTDGDGFDVLARIMYGGRVSLMVGFVVVFLECFLGVIMGGIAGYYGGWVDNLIMRLVDVFYCLPSMPIMIILGAMMDAQRMNTYIRLLIMMAALGIMGWAGVARMVRGQILSLREQEFMIATEATGIRVSQRIFHHLVPNVMPQLIVIATMGMGGVIITESTLSFLGLGVKHPLATWGTIINSVSSASAMAHYPFIWIPVGLLICLTVIAFNFVGDGLRDAYDPKSKR